MTFQREPMVLPAAIPRPHALAPTSSLRAPCDFLPMGSLPHPPITLARSHPARPSLPHAHVRGSPFPTTRKTALLCPARPPSRWHRQRGVPVLEVARHTGGRGSAGVRAWHPGGVGGPCVASNQPTRGGGQPASSQWLFRAVPGRANQPAAARG